eukprot:1783458-Rhodomonas_salina.1
MLVTLGGAVLRVRSDRRQLNPLVPTTQLLLYVTRDFASLWAGQCCVYAVIGVNLFRERDALLFGSFARALFTMFQVREREEG